MVGSNVIGAKFWGRGEILFLKGWDLKLKWAPHRVPLHQHRISLSQGLRGVATLEIDAPTMAKKQKH